MLGVSPSHVRNMIKAGNLPHTKLGKRILIQRSAVLALFEPAQNGRRKQK